jgi:sugar lactone lactonase YvrE
VADAARRIGAQLSQATARPSTDAARPVPGDWAFEGAMPEWSAAAGGLLWADTLAPAVHRADADGDHLLARLDAPIQALLAHGDGAAVASGGRWLQVAGNGRIEPLAGWPARRTQAVCRAPDGEIWACVADGERWRVMPLAGDGQLAGGWRLPEPASALAWDGAGERLYIASADSGTLQLAERGSGSLRRLATVPKGSGRLAGLAVDRAGGVWSALNGGWSVVRFLRDGSMDRVVALPVPCPTAVAFGGAAGNTLFITSARAAPTREALEAAPLAGRLFALDAAADVPA